MGFMVDCELCEIAQKQFSLLGEERCNTARARATRNL